MKSIRFFIRVLVVALGLTVIWFAWRLESVAERPEGLVEVASAEEISALAIETPVLIRGKVRPLAAEAARTWQGRFAFVHRQRQDHGGVGASRHQVLVTVAEQRPALIFDWPGGRWEIPAESYGLDRAPRVEPRAWPRKWLWTTRVEDWDKSSTGLRVGETVWLHGTVSDEGRVRMIEIWGDPWEPILAKEARTRGARGKLIFAAKIVASVFLISLLYPRSKRNRRQSAVLAPDVSRREDV